MKIFTITISLLLFFFILGNVELSSSKGIIYNDRRDSYESCIKLRMKAPYFNLKCENLLENDVYEEKINEKSENSENKIKTLYLGESGARKVNKSQEIKLRNLIQKLSNENKDNTN